MNPTMKVEYANKVVSVYHNGILAKQVFDVSFTKFCSTAPATWYQMSTHASKDF